MRLIFFHADSADLADLIRVIHYKKNFIILYPDSYREWPTFMTKKYLTGF